jgi:hypothetical protein
MIESICLQCGKSVVRYESTKSKSTYCSYGCYWKSKKGKHLSPEHRKKMSDTQKRIGNRPPPCWGRKLTEEHKQKLSMKGRHHTIESRIKMGKTRKGKYTKEKSSRWKGGHPFDSSGYILAYFPNHPHSINRCYILEHRLVMEKTIGRYLTSLEVVHHINEDRSDNRIENLMMFKNNSEHLAYHRNK